MGLEVSEKTRLKIIEAIRQANREVTKWDIQRHLMMALTTVQNGLYVLTRDGRIVCKEYDIRGTKHGANKERRYSLWEKDKNDG